MTDSQRRAVEVLALYFWRKQFGSHHEKAYEPYFQNTRDALTALRAADLVIVSRADVEDAIDAMQYVKDTYFWDKHGYQATEDALKGALGDGD